MWSIVIQVAARTLRSVEVLECPLLRNGSAVVARTNHTIFSVQHFQRQWPAGIDNGGSEFISMAELGVFRNLVPP